MGSPFDLLHDRLKAAAPPNVYVLARTQFAFDEDVEAFADVSVLAPGDDFWIVVLAARTAGFRDLAGRVWRRFAREIWFLDEADRTLARLSTAETVTFLAGRDRVRTPLLPALELGVDELFG